MRARMRALAAVSGVAAIALVTACCAAPGHPARTTGQRLARARGGGPGGGSPARARQAGERMLAGLALPRGTRRIARRRGLLPAQTVGTTDLVDVSRFYLIPAPLGSAFGFFRAHRPAGTRPAGYGTGTTPAIVSQFVWYSLAAPPAGVDSGTELIVTMVSAPGGGTIARVDAEVAWYPSRSAAEYLRPSAYREVTVTATFTSPASPETPRTRTRSFTSRSVIARLALALDRLHALAPGSISCPAFLAQFTIRFSPKPGGPGPAVVTPAGCSGDAISVGGARQPPLADGGSQQLLAVIGPLLGARQRVW